MARATLKPTRASIAAADFRMPAEWGPHDATWIVWPHNRTDWPGRFSPIPWAYAEIARWISRGEKLRVLVQDIRHERRAKRILSRSGSETSKIEFFRIPTDRGWTRDSGPAFVESAGGRREVAVRRFLFNGWAKYPDFRRDRRVPDRVARAIGMRILPAAARADVVLEGGAIDVNGRGSVVTTEECLLDPLIQVRNPGFAREDYEAVFRRDLGAPNTLWLSRGIAGDDTHGHVDDLCRFVDARTLVLCREPDSTDDNHLALEENRERLEDARLEDGSRPEVIFLPMPDPVWFDGRRLPASYANFYIANAAVLVPTFNDEKDREALGILGELFRDRPVVGIQARDLVWGLGTIHCLTRQQPAGESIARRDLRV